jgi:uncharacterized protein YhaN
VRFHRFQIPAFGPFTGLDLEFRDKPSDLHVIYGPNEAGKSSLLRAMRDLLFGLPAQTTDNFLHDYGALRIKAEICNRAGESLLFQRRKGNRNTLLDGDGNQLPEETLARFLGGVDQAYFSAMFGLGARELREGARQLLRGEGDIGHALFSASMGGTPVQKILKDLVEQAERLFKGRATANVSIRPAANLHKELLKQSREAMMPPERWEKLERELARAEDEKQVAESQISTLDRELAWISRCEDALPIAGRLREEMRNLSQLPELPELASDFVPRAQSARQAVTQAQLEVQRLAGHLARLQPQLAGCPASPAVLAQADALERLHQELGAYRQWKTTRAELQAELSGLEPLIRGGMRNLQIAGEFESLADRPLSTPLRLRCEEAAAALEKALTEHDAHACKTREIKEQIEARESLLKNLPEPNLTQVREALAVAAEATDADRTFSGAELELQRLAREAADQHDMIIGAPHDLDATASLPVPALATIRKYQQRIDKLNEDIQAAESKVLEETKRAENIQAELGRLQRQGELPSELTLRKAREHRDRGWQFVLAEWKGEGAKDELVAGLPLEQAFPQAILQADDIADALRRQAEAVAQAEEKRFQLTETEKQISTVIKQLLDLQNRLRESLESWQVEWSACGLTPRSPAEMLEWRDAWIEFKGRLRNLRTAEAAFQRKRAQIQTAKNRLAAVLGDSAEKAFSPLFENARSEVQKGEELAGRRFEISSLLSELRAESMKLEQSEPSLFEAVNAATKMWKTQCQEAGLSEGTSPGVGLALLRERNDLFSKFEEWRQQSRKQQLAAAAIGDYEQAVAKIAGALGTIGDSTEALEASLWKALASARKIQTSHDLLVEQIKQAQSDLADAQTRASQAEHTLGQLLKSARLATADDLEPFLAQLEKLNNLRARIAELRNTLSGLARGQSADEFAARVEEENADQLDQRKARAEESKREKEAALSAIRETLFGLENERRELEKAGDVAASYRQQAESCAATLREDATRFLRLRLAAHLLQTQIERFRKENQGPLLEKSGQLFKAITRGAFSGLSAEFHADDTPVLVGVRPNQTKVSVEGMSDGSRDQLYLALRLAALDQHLDQHEPMPLILDDLLITFDDERATAILPQLEVLARRTQIFLFTHHQHLAELCGQTVGEGRFHLHQLAGPGV